MKPIHENYLRRMDEKTRKSFGKLGYTVKELKDLHEKKSEKEMHEQFIGFLNRHNLPFIHARMDKRSKLPIGWPDFTVVYMRRALLIEFKCSNNKQSDDQLRVESKLRNCHTPVYLCRSYDDAVYMVKKNLFGQTST